MGCTNGLSCTEKSWIIEKQGDMGCDVIYNLRVNGKEENILMFYIDIESDTIYSGDDINNFGVPQRYLYAFFDGPVELPQ